MTRTRNHLTLIGACLLQALGCAGANFDTKPADGKSSAPAGDATNDGTTTPAPDGKAPVDEAANGTDVPVWVNGAYLTCALAGADEAGGVTVGCGLRDATGKLGDASGVQAVAWSMQTAAGALVQTTETLRSNRVLWVSLRVAGHDLPDAVLTAELRFEKPAAIRAFKRPLAELLKGLEAGGALRACLAGSTPAKDCLVASGVKSSPTVAPSGSCLVPVKDTGAPAADIAGGGFDEVAADLAACSALTGAREADGCRLTLDAVDPKSATATVDDAPLAFGADGLADRILSPGTHKATLKIGAATCTQALTIVK